MNSNNQSKMSSSPSWILNWFSQLRNKKSTDKSSLFWKKEYKDQPTSVVTTEPIMITRPSITLSVAPSIASERRSSQQTVASSWTTSDDQSRRDSLERPDLLKRRHKFHWPYSHSPRAHDTDLNRQKRLSVSSSPSRPNSIIYNSEPPSPNFMALFTNEEDLEGYVLEKKEERWKMNPDLTRLALDGLFSSPEMATRLSFSIEKHILQVSCGNAEWAIEVARQYPKWVVIGLDDTNNELLLPRNIPKNFKFVECSSILQGLKRIPSQTFDIISCRFLLFTVPFEEYKQVMKECLRILKPNCYLEFMELDLRVYYQRLLSIPTRTNKINQLVMESIELDSLDPRLARKLQELVKGENVIESKYISLPLGIWGGRLGVMFKDDLQNLIEMLLNDQQELDKELDLNRAFMNLHLLVIQS